ncbi:MAG: YjbQ family protein [Candidatus Firestonebacteria bacterium]|nr:YjbQ family protein [Candidatus Firestonebacteria bacterium]
MQTWFRKLVVETRRRAEMIDVTARLQAAVEEARVASGLLTAQAMHTTAGMTINENADPDVVGDLLAQLERLAENPAYRHSEGNSDAHLKASLLGASVTLPVVQGRLVLGTWQGIYFCEFDGPRLREMAVTVLGE